MLRWLGKMLLFRILPRKLLPILTVIEVARFLRNARNPDSATRPVEPSAGGVRPTRAVPGGLPWARPQDSRAQRVVGTSGPEDPAARGGSATVIR